MNTKYYFTNQKRIYNEIHHSSATLHYIQCIITAFISTYPTFEEGKKEIFLHRKGNFSAPKSGFFCTEKEIFLHRKADSSTPKSGFFCTEKRILLHRKADSSAPKSGFFCTVKRAKKTTGHFCKIDGLFYQKRRVTFIKTTGRFFRTSGGSFSTISRWVFSNISRCVVSTIFRCFSTSSFQKNTQETRQKNLGHWETSERFLIVMNRGGRSGRGLPQEKDKCPERKKLLLKEKLQQHSVCPQQHRRGKLVRARFWND